MSFGDTGSHNYVLVRLIEISTRWKYQMVFYSGRLWVKNSKISSGIIQFYYVMICIQANLGINNPYLLLSAVLVKSSGIKDIPGVKDL